MDGIIHIYVCMLIHIQRKPRAQKSLSVFYPTLCRIFCWTRTTFEANRGAEVLSDGCAAWEISPTSFSGKGHRWLRRLPVAGLCNYVKSQSSWHLEKKRGSSLLAPAKFGCITKGFFSTHSFMDFLRTQEITVMLERISLPYGLQRKNLVFQG